MTKAKAAADAGIVSMLAAAAPIRSVTAKKAAEIERSLTESGAVGFDPASIIAMILAFIKMFTDCRQSPTKAQQRLAALSRGRYYVGINLDRLRLRNVVQGSDLCHGCDEDTVTAVVLDVAGGMTVEEIGSLYREAQQG